MLDANIKNFIFAFYLAKIYFIVILIKNTYIRKGIRKCITNVFKHRRGCPSKTFYSGKVLHFSGAISNLEGFDCDDK